MKVLRRVFPPPRDRKDAILWAHELTGALWITLPDGTSGKVADGGGGGTSDHAALTHLAWLSSAHTLSGTYKLAGSAASTAAAEVAYTAFTATLLDDPDAATARATLGAAYVSRSISTTLPLAGGGDLSADRTLTLSGWSGTTDGRPLYRNGTAVATATVSAPLTFTAGALAITQSDATHDGYLSSADWSVFNSKQAGSAELTGLASLGDGIPVRSTTWQTLGYSTGLSLSSTTLTLDSGLQSLTSADASAGLPYVTVANTWATATYTAMLSVVGGAWKVIGWRESGGQDLTNGAIADGQLVARVGTTIAGVDVSATPAASKVVKSGAGGTIDNGWLDADIKALGDNSTNGLWARTGSGTGSARTLTAGSGVTITNGDGVSGNPTIAASGSGGATGTAAAVTTYGGAFDGDVTFDTGGSTPSGWTKSGSTYTRDTANGECQYKTVTFAQDSIILDLAGSPFRCRSYNPTAKNGIGVVNVGTVGTAGSSGGAGGTGAAPATLATSSAGSVFYGGTNGGVGNVGANGGAGTAAPAGSGYGGGTGGKGGGARSTVAATIRAGGAGGGGTNAGARPQFYGNPWSMIAGGLLAWRNGTGLLQIAGGTGGGGGGGSGGAPLKGGGGAGGGGVLLFAAETAAFGTGCYFSVDGSDGGAGYVVATTDTAGGGGGAGGGRMMVAIGTITGSNLPDFYGRGGAGGSAAIGATGYWAEGGNGGDGGKLEIYVGTNNVGGTPTVTVTGGTAGTNFGSGTGYVGSSAGSNGTYKYGEGA